MLRRVAQCHAEVIIVIIIIIISPPIPPPPLQCILRAVAQCHAKGIIIRDVKPENFLFLSSRPDAPLKMIDFGMAGYCPPGKVYTDRAGGCGCMGGRGTRQGVRA